MKSATIPLPPTRRRAGCGCRMRTPTAAFQEHFWMLKMFYLAVVVVYALVAMLMTILYFTGGVLLESKVVCVEVFIVSILCLLPVTADLVVDVDYERDEDMPRNWSGFLNDKVNRQKWADYALSASGFMMVKYWDAGHVAISEQFILFASICACFALFYHYERVATASARSIVEGVDNNPWWYPTLAFLGLLATQIPLWTFLAPDAIMAIVGSVLSLLLFIYFYILVLVAAFFNDRAQNHVLFDALYLLGNATTKIAIGFLLFYS